MSIGYTHIKNPSPPKLATETQKYNKLENARKSKSPRTSNMAQAAPMPSIYLQIEYGNSPWAILGVSENASSSEIQSAYRAICLKIHPDKASESLQDLQTSLFQKLQAAYDALVQSEDDHVTADAFHASRQLPETPESLHARNVAFHDALRSERANALKYNNEADMMKATKEATLKAKNERLAEKRALRAQAQAEAEARRQAKIAKKARAAGSSKQSDAGEEDLSWEQLEDLEAEAESAKAKAKTLTKPSRPAQNLPTARTAQSTWVDGVDERLVSDAEIKGRWNRSLLSGGRGGSVSLAQKKQRENNAASRSHKATMALCGEVDDMVKAALTGSNRTFSALEVEEALDTAFVGVEEKSQARTDRFLQVMNSELAEQTLLEEGETKKRSLAIKEK